MVIVMLAIGMSLALTYGFVRTQVTSLRLTQNDSRRDLALEAARTGLSIGLKRMQAPEWVGVSDVYTKVIQQDTTNKTVCDVWFEPLVSGQVPGVPDIELPLHLRIVSKGTWSAPSDTAEQVSRTVKAVVRLMPRLPGRTARAGDLVTASDQAVNPANYEATLAYSLTAKGTGTSLNFDPGARVEGPIWLRDDIAFFTDPDWSSSVRATMLTETGNQLGSSSGSASFQHPHPLNGPIVFSSTPQNAIKTDLSRLKTTWTTTAANPSVASLNVNLWSNYRLYDRGINYQAVSLGGTLENTTLRPSASNPLGVFVRAGDLSVRNGVVVQGTLIVTGNISIQGAPVTITSYNWRGTGGSPLITGADQWPRLPAIAAANLSFTREARVVVEGAVLLNGNLTGGGGEFQWRSGTQVNLTGTATAIRGQQPYSTVQLVNSPSLSTLSGDLRYAIWLAEGTSGRWYQIQSVDVTARKLTVVGEVQITTAVPYRIRLNRDQFVELNGPLVANTVDIDRCLPWDLSTSQWNDREDDWDDTNDLLVQAGQPRIPFPTWLANPANFIGWSQPLPTTGLPLEPTFHLRPLPGVKHLSTGPHFRPFVGTTTTDSAYSGYRWKIVDWREET
ncbi:MAG: hypothetical protein AABP62_15750 [Planctomycetota bacterium]